MVGPVPVRECFRLWSCFLLRWCLTRNLRHAALQESALAFVLAELERQQVRLARLVGASGAPQQVGASGVEQVTVAQGLAERRLIEQRQTTQRAISHRDSDRAVQFDNRRR